MNEEQTEVEHLRQMVKFQKDLLDHYAKYITELERNINAMKFISNELANNMNGITASTEC